jgi:hypothetical protein
MADASSHPKVSVLCDPRATAERAVSLLTEASDLSPFFRPVLAPQGPSRSKRAAEGVSLASQLGAACVLLERRECLVLTCPRCEENLARFEHHWCSRPELVVFRHLISCGWIVKPGNQYGAHFLVYRAPHVVGDVAASSSSPTTTPSTTTITTTPLAIVGDGHALALVVVIDASWTVRRLRLFRQVAETSRKQLWVARVKDGEVPELRIVK